MAALTTQTLCQTGRPATEAATPPDLHGNLTHPTEPHATNNPPPATPTHPQVDTTPTHPLPPPNQSLPPTLGTPGGGPARPLRPTPGSGPATGAAKSTREGAVGGLLLGVRDAPVNADRAPVALEQDAEDVVAARRQGLVLGLRRWARPVRDRTQRTPGSRSRRTKTSTAVRPGPQRGPGQTAIQTNWAPPASAGEHPGD